MFRKMPVILLVIISLIVFFQKWIPIPWQSFFYSLSLSIKSLMSFLLPALLFMLLFKTLSRLSKGATRMVVFILVAVCCSNFISTMISYQIGSIVYKFDLALPIPQDSIGLNTLWVFSLPKWIPNDTAMFAGVILGIVLPLWKADFSQKLAAIFDKGVNGIIKLFMGMIPFFIAGFVMKFVHDQVFENLLKNYALIFLIVACSQFTYIFCIYFLANRFKFSPFISCLKNMLPASIVGFSSMSSAAAMPLTLIGTEKNTQNPLLSRFLIPTTVNIHLVGDCFAIPIFAFAVMKSFGVIEPSFFTYALFAFYFVIAKFSVAAVPGGGILVMLPILESYLGFDAAMGSLIFALYVLFDPIITCANVLGNGGFALAISKVMKKEKLTS